MNVAKKSVNLTEMTVRVRNVAKKSANFADLNVPISALYLLAASLLSLARQNAASARSMALRVSLRPAAAPFE